MCFYCITVFQKYFASRPRCCGAHTRSSSSPRRSRQSLSIRTGDFSCKHGQKEHDKGGRVEAAALSSALSFPGAKSQPLGSATAPTCFSDGSCRYPCRVAAAAASAPQRSASSRAGCRIRRGPGGAVRSPPACPRALGSLLTRSHLQVPAASLAALPSPRQAGDKLGCARRAVRVLQPPAGALGGFLQLFIMPTHHGFYKRKP